MPSVVYRIVAPGVAEESVTVTDPDIPAFRQATMPVIEAFRARVKSPLVDQALKEAGVLK